MPRYRISFKSIRTHSGDEVEFVFIYNVTVKGIIEELHRRETPIDRISVVLNVISQEISNNLKFGKIIRIEELEFP